MPNDIANPDTGAESEEAAVAYLLGAQESPQEEKAEEAPVAEQPADDGQEPEPEAELAEGDAEQAEPEPDEPEPDPEPETFTVKVAGEERQVTRDELVKGYQLEADYRRKTAALSEESKTERAQIEQAKQELKAERLEFLTMKDEVEPDWVALAQEDPIGSIEKRAQWDAKQRQKAEAQQEFDAQQEQQKRDHATREWNTLMEKVPEWQDRKAFEAATAEITETAQTYGFSQEQIAENLDHRVLLVMRDAAEYRKLKSAQPEIDKKIAAAPKSIKPGATKSKATVSAEQRQKLRENLELNPGDESAAIAYLTG